MNEPLDPNPPADHYQVCQEGPLTYYNCFVEDLVVVPEVTPETRPSASALRPFVAGFMGAGLAATAVAGFTIAQNNQQDKAPVSQDGSSTKEQSSRQARDNRLAAKSQWGFNPSAPETIGTKAFSATRLVRHNPIPQSRLEQPIASPRSATPQQATAGTRKPTTPPLQQQMLPTVPLTVSLPERLPLPPAPIVQAAPSQLAARPIRTTPVSPAKPAVADRTITPTPAATAATTTEASPMVAQPQPTNPVAVTSTPQPPSTNPVADSLAPLPVATQAKAVQEMVNGAEAGRSAQATSSAVSTSSTVANAATTSPRFQLPDKIQDFLAFPQQSGRADTIRLLPLTSQAAAEAQSAKKIETFTVRKLTTPDYQREWLVSSKIPPTDEAAKIMPTYGFIDYQRQVIVLPQDASTATLPATTASLPTESAATTPSKGAPTPASNRL